MAKGLDFDWCLGADRGLVQPDLVIYFDISAEKLAQRSGFGEERFEKIEFQQKVEEAYNRFRDGGISHQEFLEEGYAPEKPNRWVNLKLGEESIEEVQETIKNIVLKYESAFKDRAEIDEINAGLFK